MNAKKIPGFGLGWLIALLVLIVVVIFAVTGAVLTRNWELAGFAALALAILLP